MSFTQQCSAQACLKTAREAEDQLMEGRALWQLGRLAGHQGYHSDARRLKGEGMLLMEAMLGPDHLDIAKCCTGDNSSNLALEHYLGLLLNMYASQVLLGRAACCMRTRRLKTTMAAHTAYSRTASVQSTNWCSTQ